MVDAPEPDPLLLAELDRGEAEVIALANSSRPSLAIIDEKRGRRIAAHVYRLPLKGTAGVLVKAHRRGLLDDLRATLHGLKREGYFLDDAIIDTACQAANRTWATAKADYAVAPYCNNEVRLVFPRVAYFRVHASSLRPV